MVSVDTANCPLVVYLHFAKFRYMFVQSGVDLLYVE